MFAILLILFYRSQTPGQTDSPQTPQPSKISNELVNALSSNHDKRKEIATLKNEITRLERQLNEQRTNRDHTSPKSSTSPANRECVKCKPLQEQVELQNKELENLRANLEEAASSRNELQANMVDLVRTMDKKKLQDSDAQSKATLKFVDDAKETLRKELERTHQRQCQKLETEIEKLSGELLYTKEEYVRLCEDMKNLEQRVQQNVQNESKLELEEMKLQMEHEFQEKLKCRENELSMKHIEDLDKEKKIWQDTATHEMQV